MMSMKTTASYAGALVVAVAVTGCAPSHAAAAQRTPTTTTAAVAAGQLPVGDPAAPMPKPGSCTLGNRAGQPVPDPHCTPGATNPAVTQANISATICRPGWTKTVRPPVSKTNQMKAASARSYRLPAERGGEYDHLVPLSLGGAPDDPRNLWVEPGRIPNPKDAVEARLHDAVCSGHQPRLSLAEAQRAIATNWVDAEHQLGVDEHGTRTSTTQKGQHR